MENIPLVSILLFLQEADITGENKTEILSRCDDFCIPSDDSSDVSVKSTDLQAFFGDDIYHNDFLEWYN
jgi:hypothetical protein